MKQEKESLIHRLVVWLKQSQWLAATLAGLFLALVIFAVMAFRILDPWERTPPFFVCANVLIIGVVAFAMLLSYHLNPENAPNTKKQVLKWIAAWFVGIVTVALGGLLLGIAMPFVSYMTGKTDTLATSSAGLERGFNLAQATFFASLVGVIGALATATAIEIIKRKTESA